MSTNIRSRSEHEEEDSNVLVILKSPIISHEEPDHFPMARIVGREYAQSDFNETFKTSRLRVDKVANDYVVATTNVKKGLYNYSDQIPQKGNAIIF